MNKAIGFSLAYGREPPRPKWLDTYPWLNELTTERSGWHLRLWGHGDLAGFVDGNRVLVGYSDLDTLPPLDNRSVLIELGENAAIANDFGGYLPVFYGNGMASTDEGCIESGRTLDPARVVSLLLFNCLIAGATLWKEVNYLPANSVLGIAPDGRCWETPQEPLDIGESRVEDMAEVLERTIRRSTDALGDVYLTVSAGYDSRLIMVNMDRPERIRARTYPIARPIHRNGEWVIAQCSVWSAGIDDHKAVSAWNYGRYLPQLFDFLGSTVSPLNGYIGSFLIRTCNKKRLPLIHGVAGDTLAGNPVVHDQNKVSWRWDEAGRFEQLCRTDPHAWKLEGLDRLLTFDWRAAVATLRPTWAEMWRRAEGNTIAQRADLARLRNRTAMLILPTFSIADVYGGLVSPYCDREYTEYMLGLPDKCRLDRTAQKAMARERWPDIFPQPESLSASDWDPTNTIDHDNISEAAIWPTEELDHPMFQKDYVEELRARALAGDTHSFWLLFPLQAIVYGVNHAS